MRVSLLSSVSFLFLAVAPFSAQAAFEFSPPVQTQQAARPAAAPVDQAIQEPVSGPANSYLGTPIASDEVPAPVRTPVNVAPLPMADIKEDVKDEPLVLGRQAIPLTPVIQDSDALVMDEGAPASAPVSSSAPAPVTSVKDVLWDNDAPSTYGASTSSNDVLPAPVQSDLLPPASAVSSYDDVAPSRQTADARAAATMSELQGGDAVQGFGRDVPLALALQQIVPPSYRYSFDQGVNPGIRVNWTGGKPWKAIIADLARENDLNVDIVTNVVAFRRRTALDVVSTDTSHDTIQGMGIRAMSDRYTPPAPPAPVVSPASANPMSILDHSSSDIAVAPRTKLASTRDAAPQTSNFDSLLDGDRPASGVVKEKRILVADEPTSILPATGSAYASEAAAAELVADTAYAAPASVASSAPAPVAPLPILYDAPASASTSSVKPVEAPVNIVPNEPVHEAPLPVASTTGDWLQPSATDAIAAAPVLSADTYSASAAVDLTTVLEWEGYKNQTLRETLNAWSERAGVSVVWSSEYDYPLQTDVRIKGTFAEALRTLLAGFSKAQPRPMGRLFKNDKVGAQPVLVVETQRLTN